MSEVEDVQPEGVAPEGEDSSPQEPPKRNHAEERIGKLTREKRELERKLQEKEALAQQPPQPGAAPTLDEHNWDEPAYQRAMVAWVQSNQQRPAVQAPAVDTGAVAKHWQHVGKLGVNDYDSAHSAVSSQIGDDKLQAVIASQRNRNLAGAIYSIAKDPDVLYALGDMDDAELLGAFVERAGELKASTQKLKPTAPDPATQIASGQAPSVSSQALEKALNAAAEDPSKFKEYQRLRREQRGKQ